MDLPPIVLDFPLRGEWVAAHTPAEAVPSHGTDALGQRYAFDFVQIERNRKGWKFFRPSRVHYFFFGAALQECYCWGEPIYAPFDGKVVTVRDGRPETTRIHPAMEFGKSLMKSVKRFLSVFAEKEPIDFQSALGNYIILKMSGEDIFAFFAHARMGSIRVQENETVLTGQILANIGNSGQTTAPHLHFHIMDRADIVNAQGLPCCFRRYELLRNGSWTWVSNHTPALRQFVRRPYSENDQDRIAERQAFPASR